MLGGLRGVLARRAALLNPSCHRGLWLKVRPQYSRDLSADNNQALMQAQMTVVRCAKGDLGAGGANQRHR